MQTQQLNSNLTRNATMPAGKRWRTLWYHPYLMPYNLIILTTIVCNTIIAWHGYPFTTKSLFDIILLNFSIALLFRQQYVINFLFRIFTALPHCLPLNVRRMAGKVYHYGGLPVGCYFCGVLWLIYLCVMLANDATLLFYLACLHAAVLISIAIVALPTLRAKWHNLFERVARFGNWFALLLLWLETYLFFWGLHNEIIWHAFTALLLISWHTVLPWLRLRKVALSMTISSAHAAVLRFDYGVTPFAGSSTEISCNPLWEWHAFANVPNLQQSGFRLLVSRAGDWTGKLIDNPPQHVWVKGIPTAGVGNIEKLFKHVLWVATGSGIGPCLPHLLSKKIPAHLLWITRNPRATYGDALVEEIISAQPEAWIWNTSAAGKPDVEQLVWEAYKHSNAEAVICIANKKATWKVVHALESRNVPAFGAIWDS